jgi:enoyl-CoA hydratase/carnithine racemase
MPQDLICHHEIDGIHHITLNRPKKRNALNIAMMKSLTALLNTINAINTSKGILITANGPVFSAGADLSEMKERPSEITHALLDLVAALEKNQLMMNIMIEEDVFAGAHILIGFAHSVMALESVRFKLPEVERGIWPFLVMSALKRSMPHKHAWKMMLTAKAVDATKACHYGLISDVEDSKDALNERVNEWSQMVRSLDVTTVKRATHAWSKLDELSYADSHSMCGKLLLETLQHSEATSLLDF